MKMYDTMSGDHSRSKFHAASFSESVQRFLWFFAKRGIVCPHISFVNSRAGDGAPPRESVETRSVVITRV